MDEWNCIEVEACLAGGRGKEGLFLDVGDLDPDSDWE